MESFFFYFRSQWNSPMTKLDKIIYLKSNKYVAWLMIINNLDLGMWLSYLYSELSLFSQFMIEEYPLFDYSR